MFTINFFFFFNDTATTEIYTLSLHDALPIYRLSGTAWGVAYVGGLISLAVTLGLLAASPVTGKTLLGFAPIFGLDPLSHEGDRATGPFTALWLLAFAWPL